MLLSIRTRSGHCTTWRASSRLSAKAVGPNIRNIRNIRVFNASYNRCFWRSSRATEYPSTYQNFRRKLSIFICFAGAASYWWVYQTTRDSGAGVHGKLHEQRERKSRDAEKPHLAKDTSSWGGLEFLRNSAPKRELSSILTAWSWPEEFRSIQGKVSALILELGRGPGSLYSEIVNSPPDPSAHPECQWDAEVRLGDELCLSERAFLRERKRRMKRGFAKLFGVDESEIDERDLPVVAIAGSGGGFRAMLNTISSLISAQQSGILDCVTYLAGISGSCWAIGTMYSGVSGSVSPGETAEHLIERINTSYLDMDTLDMLVTPPTNKYLLYGLLRKATSPGSNISLTDLYGTLVSARFLVPRDLSNLDFRHLSLHHFRRAVDDGSMPLPIFVAVHHEVPANLEEQLSNIKIRQATSTSRGSDEAQSLKHQEEEIERASKWLWFEFTPYEVGCDDLGAWIPTWSFGRQFLNGKSTDRNPEISLTILNGIYASAFCATLQHYFVEIQPLLQQLPGPLYDWINEVMTENKKELGSIHPVLPNELPNFVRGMDGQLKSGSPQDITDRETIGLMDAGAELNIPYYPLFRRDVDCIITLDASADSQDLWFTRAEQYASRRGLTRWPKGARWPVAPRQSAVVTSVAEGFEGTTNLPGENTTNCHLTKAQERAVPSQAVGNGVSEVQHHDDSGRATSPNTIWIGSSSVPSSSTSSLVESLEEQDLLQRDGIAIIYNPLVPNENAVPNFDPMDVSTWVVRMDKEEAKLLARVSEANFAEGKSKVVRLLKMIWLRKRTKRLEAERKERNHSVWADIRSLNANPHHDKSWRGVEGWMSR